MQITGFQELQIYYEIGKKTYMFFNKFIVSSCIKKDYELI